MKHGSLFAIAALLALAACGGGQDAQAAPADQAAAPAAAPAASGSALTLGQAVTPTGNVIEVKMVTDEKGNYFEPADFTVKKGDTVRFVLVSGVHNVNFPADKNPGIEGLGGPGEMLQLPGQALEVVVGLDAGSYYYQCDPHAALGMVGMLNVQ